MGELTNEGAVERLQAQLDGFDRENADDIDNEDFNIGQDEYIEVASSDLRALLSEASAGREAIRSVVAGYVAWLEDEPSASSPFLILENLRSHQSASPYPPKTGGER